MDQALDAGLQLHERAIVGDVRHGALETRADGILGLDAGPRIGLQLLHAEADALRLGIDAHDLHLDRVADVDDLARMIDAPPGHVGDVQQAVDAAQIDERAVVGDVLDEAVDDLAFGQLGDDLGALLGARGFQDLAARYDDIAATAVHLQDLEGLRRVHERAHVAHGPHVDLAARQERHGAVEVDGEAALDLVEDDAFDLFLVVELLLEADPAFLAPRLVARQHGFAERVLRALDVDLDGVADLELALLAGQAEFAQLHPAFHLQSDVDDGEILLDRGDVPLTTLPSKTSSSDIVSPSRAAKSSRVGLSSLLVVPTFVLICAPQSCLFVPGHSCQWTGRTRTACGQAKLVPMRS